MKTLKEYTDLELKGEFYNNLVNKEVAEANIKAINEELNLRSKSVEVETVKEEDISE